MTIYQAPRRSILPICSLGLAIFISGCASKPTGWPKPEANRAERETRGYVYYFDGAGGGTAKTNYAEGVQKGFLAAGYEGAGEMLSWETGKGLMADQDASVEYKRAQAQKAAKTVTKHAEAYPGVPMGFLGFSAGTAQAIFTLEALPEAVKVDDVVLLGTSISRDYDLTKALKKIDGKLYIYTSTKDRMLGFLMPFSGTADRKFDDPGAGITGFVLPKGADAATRKLYKEKIVTIPWTAQLEKDGDYGRHFDNVKMEFIRDHVAPLFMGKKVAGLPN
jgi:hypothetical protein